MFIVCNNLINVIQSSQYMQTFDHRPPLACTKCLTLIIVRLVREAAKNTLRGGSLKIGDFGHKVLTPTKHQNFKLTPPKS